MAGDDSQKLMMVLLMDIDDSYSYGSLKYDRIYILERKRSESDR